jgi:RNA polymerase sigma factor (sigma-70 family)
MNTMKTLDDLIPTRKSLLSRLKRWDDQDSWKAFFDTYWRLIYQTALKAGLSDSEAQDVVQETIIGVVKEMPDFQYHAERGSFKGWLHQLTWWRICDRMRLRAKEPAEVINIDGAEPQADLAKLAVVDEAGWEADWERNLLDAALDRLKKKVDAKHFQIFDLYVFKEWPVTKIAGAFKVSTASIYTIKSRLQSLLKDEVDRLRAEADREADRFHKGKNTI